MKIIKLRQKNLIYTGTIQKKLQNTVNALKIQNHDQTQSIEYF